ncbi:hypothetical protein IWX65_003523 [Arthrobacter sp. CAN_A214]
MFLSSLDGGKNLDVVTVVDGYLGPLVAGYDLGVDGDGYP